MKTDVRWKQRFQNFEKSLHYLQEGIKIKNRDIIQKAGLIQFFEISIELSWNLLKDFLEEQGFHDLKSPRDSIKKAFEVALIQNGHIWLQTLNNRNMTSHTYDEEMADKVVEEIIYVYYPLLQQLYDRLKSEI